MSPYRRLRAVVAAFLVLSTTAVVAVAADQARPSSSANTEVDVEFWRGIDLNERRRRIIEEAIRDGAVLARLERVIVEIVGPPLASGPDADGGADIASAAEGYRTVVAILRRYAQEASGAHASPPQAPALREQAVQGQVVQEQTLQERVAQEQAVQEQAVQEQIVRALLEEMVAMDAASGKTPPAEAREGVRRFARTLADHYARDFCDRLVRSRVGALLPARSAPRRERKRALRALDAQIAVFEAGREPESPDAAGAVLAAEATAACREVGLSDPRERIGQALRLAVDLERMWLEL